MRKEKIYIGLYKDHHESVFYEKKNGTLFYDLIEQRIVPRQELKSDTFFPYKSRIQTNSPWVREWIRLYNLEQMKTVTLSKVFIGNIFELDDVGISIQYTQGNSFLKVKEEKVSPISLVKENALLLLGGYSNREVDLDTDNLIDMENGDIYPCDVDFKNLNRYVPRTPKHLKQASKILDIQEENIEKGKLLEKYREYKGSMEKRGD